MQCYTYAITDHVNYGHEKGVVKMSAGFQLHNEAVCIRQCLHTVFEQASGCDQKMPDISEVYEAPIRMCAEVLQYVSDTPYAMAHFQMIQEIKVRYATYYRYILSQLDDATLQALCRDLNRLTEQ